MTTHLITGATGFVGSAIVLELLQHDATRVVGVVRPSAHASPTERLRSTLHDLVGAYDLPHDLHHLIETRVEAVAGDLHAPRCGVQDLDLPGAEFWHCAASLQYQDRHQEQIFATNVSGTQHASDLAAAMGASRLNSISTAYVAGSRTGTIPEAPGHSDHVNNHYERSKIEAERIASACPVPTRLLRPSIVIGHSTTHHALNYNGLYGFVRSVTKFAASLERAQPGLAANLQIRMRVDPEATLNLVPVDHVAQQAVALSMADAPAGTYHLTNASPPPVGECIHHLFDLVGMKRPIYVDDVDQLGDLDAKLHRGIDFYRSYLVHPKTFDRTRTDTVLGAQPGYPLPTERFTHFCRWYLDVLQAKATRLPVAR